MPSYDHYVEAERIASMIEAQGLVGRAQYIRQAMQAFSGTEIFMALRFHLLPLLEDFTLAPSIRAQVSTLIDEIERSLAP